MMRATTQCDERHKQAGHPDRDTTRPALDALCIARRARLARRSSTRDRGERPSRRPAHLHDNPAWLSFFAAAE